MNSESKRPSAGFRRGRVLVLGLTTLLASSSLLADWLVTTDGGRIETKGPWRVEGRRVLYTTPGGTLAAVRLSAVDLDASAVATAQAKEERTEVKDVSPSTEKPVLVLKGRDVPRSLASVSRSSDSAEAADSDNDSGGVEVTRWDDVTPAGEEVRIRGEVKNGTPDQLTTVNIQVTLYDESGNSIAKRVTSPQVKTMGPGESAPFEISFPDVYYMSAVRFSVQHRGFKTAKEAPSGSAEGGPEG